LCAVLASVYSSSVRRHACATILLGGWLIMLPPSKTSVVGGDPIDWLIVLGEQDE
jgi:hypothetical protein